MTAGSRSDAGFTLVEMLVAMVILGIGLLALGLAQIQTISSTTGSKQLSQAMYLAEEQMDLFYAMPAASGVFLTAATTNDPVNPIDLDPNDGDTTTFNRRWTVQPNTPSFGLTTITVDVDWLNPQGSSGTTQRRVSLQGVK